MMTCYGCDYAFNMELLTEYGFQGITEMLCPDCLYKVEGVVA
jgi:hypothetical protein